MIARIGLLLEAQTALRVVFALIANVSLPDPVNSAMPSLLVSHPVKLKPELLIAPGAFTVTVAPEVYGLLASVGAPVPPFASYVTV